MGIDIALNLAPNIFQVTQIHFVVQYMLKRKLSKIKQTAVRMGDFVFSENCVLAIRGLRTLQSRLRTHQQNASEIFLFLKNVKKILYLPDDKNKYHRQWKNILILQMD